MLFLNFVDGEFNKVVSIKETFRLQALKSIIFSAVAILGPTVPTLADMNRLAPPKLGVRSDGSLFPCPKNNFDGCISSQDDEPSVFIAPWEYDGSFDAIKSKLKEMVLGSIKYSNLVTDSDRYLRFKIDDNKSMFENLIYYTCLYIFHYD